MTSNIAAATGHYVVDYNNFIMVTFAWPGLALVFGISSAAHILTHSDYNPRCILFLKVESVSITRLNIFTVSMFVYLNYIFGYTPISTERHRR